MDMYYHQVDNLAVLQEVEREGRAAGFSSPYTLKEGLTE